MNGNPLRMSTVAWRNLSNVKLVSIPATTAKMPGKLGSDAKKPFEAKVSFNSVHRPHRWVHLQETFFSDRMPLPAPHLQPARVPD